MTSLQLLGLSANQLSGLLPGAQTSHEAVNLYSSVIEGAVRRSPPSLAHLSTLRRLMLTQNKFGGSIPTTFSALKSLEVLALSDNQLVGKIPTKLSSLIKLQL